MGFDLNIMMSLYMCTETGKPYSIGEGFKKVYDIPSLEIPPELKQYLEQRGHYLHAYTDEYNEQNIYSVDLENFKATFPSWEDVQDHPTYDEFWTEEDHKNFEKLVNLLLNSRVNFSVSWSY